MCRKCVIEETAKKQKMNKEFHEVVKEPTQALACYRQNNSHTTHICSIRIYAKGNEDKNKMLKYKNVCNDHLF